MQHKRKADPVEVLEFAWEFRSHKKAAERFGISRERVRQICERAGVDIVAVRMEERAERLAGEAQAHEAAADPTKYLAEFHELCTSRGAVPTSYALQNGGHNGLEHNLRRHFGSVARLIRETSEDLGLPIERSPYMTDRRATRPKQ